MTKRIAAAVMPILILFCAATGVDARTGGAGYFACTFDSGYVPRRESHGEGFVELQNGKGEICVPGQPLDCESATRQGDKIVSSHWALRIEGRGKCKAMTAR